VRVHQRRGGDHERRPSGAGGGPGAQGRHPGAPREAGFERPEELAERLLILLEGAWGYRSELQG
jgi:hypothetical protein